ncbi:hypothetical protein KXR53_17640 [Inquilinus limosus]|uniref:hypothetical protein n=1 Tax=Inquilinus limosus TaxID=171674 RepID=UPI003F18F9FD
MDELFEDEFELELLEEFELELLDELELEFDELFDDELELELDELLPATMIAPSLRLVMTGDACSTSMGAA